jgi:hypothetical protein
MAYIRATGHNVPLMMQIAKGGHAQMYAKVLHASSGFHPASIYIEEEVLSEGKNKYVNGERGAGSMDFFS